MSPHASPPYSLSEELFDELLDLWHQLRAGFDTNAVAAPFVPLVGTSYGEHRAPKVMYIGKATEGWSDEPEMSLATRHAFTHGFYESLCCRDYAGFAIDAVETTYTLAGGGGAKKVGEVLITSPS